MDERNNDFDFDFMPIGQAIKKAREARGMTREQLAGIIGYAPRHISALLDQQIFQFYKTLKQKASIMAIHINMKCFFSHTMHLLTASLYEKRCTPSNMPAKGRNKLQKNAFYSVTFAHPISKVFCMIFRQISRRGRLISKNRKFSANH